MELLKLAYLRIKALFTRGALERELDDEMRLHIDLLAEQYERDGMSRRDAKRAAGRRFGNVPLIKERARDIRGSGMLGDLLQDVRYAARTFGKSPLFFAIVVLSLALGIGANTAIFSAVNGRYFKTLPVARPNELVRFMWSGRNDIANRTSQFGYTLKDGRGRPLHAGFSVRVFEEFRKSNHSLQDLLACASILRMNIIADGRAETGSVLLISGSYFKTLGILAGLGRVITPDDDRPGAAAVAMISNAYWNRRFGAAPEVIGKTVTVNNLPLTIVGVTPSGFYGVERMEDKMADIILPLAADDRQAGGGRSVENFWWLEVVGRMKPGVTPAQVEADLAATYQQIARRSNVTKKEDPAELHVEPGSRGVFSVEPVDERSVKVLGAAVVFLLMIVCANVASLLLSRATARQREMSVRLSLGATRLRLLRQLLTESVLLAITGGALGLAAAYWLKKLMLYSVGEASGMDWRVFTFVALLSLLVGIAFGLAPALRATRIGLAGNLNISSRTITGSRTILGKSLIAIQVAMSMVLLIGAGLLLRTVQNLRHVDLGFNPRNLLIFRLSPSLNGYDAARTLSVYDQVTEALEALPGVQAVSLSQRRLLSDEVGTATVALPDQDVIDPAPNQVHMTGVSPNFFTTMEIPLVTGRQFEASENRSDAHSVAIINEATAKKFFPGQDPLGRTLRRTAPGPNFRPIQIFMEIVGVVKDTRHYTLRDAPPPTVYLPYRQLGASGMTFEVRTAQDPSKMAPAVQDAIRRVDAAIPLIELATQVDQQETRFSDERLFAFAFSLFGLMAALLASIGLFGTMAYTVARRTNEMGVRLALGAQRRTVIGLVLRESVGLTLAGIAIGVIAALAGGRLLTSLLFGLAASDGVTYAAVTLLMIAVSIAASYLPARRASRVDPIVALRYE